MTDPYTVALVQDAGVMFDRSAAVNRVGHWVAKAKAAGASLVLFPEAYVGGYPKGIDFGVRLGQRSDAGRKVFRRYFDGAIAQGDDAQAQLGGLARDHGLWLVIGVVERVGATLHCAVWTFDDQGRLAAVHRKLMPTALERCVWGFGDGSTMPVIETPLGRLGAAICWENYMPLYRASLYAKGIQIYCAPTVDERDNWIHTVRHIALEGRCFVLSCCQYMTRADMPGDLDPIQGDDPDTVLIRGGSCVVSPLGDLLAEPLYGASGLITAEIDLGRIAEGKFDLDTAGHYGRPDVFQLLVDETPREGTNFFVADNAASGDD